jgi:hypothetical protein
MCATCPALRILLDLIILIISEENIIRPTELIIMQFSLASCHFIPPGSKYSSQHPVLKHLNLCLSETVSVENTLNASKTG